MIFRQWEVGVSTFPFVEGQRTKVRPVLIISTESFHRDHDVVVSAMITSTARPWRTDHPIRDLDTAGLKRPCVIRWKIFTLVAEGIVQRIGWLGGADRGAAMAALSRIFAVDNLQRAASTP